MKKTLIVLGMVLCSTTVAVASTITGVTAQQRYPWNGKVDISYTVTGDIAVEAKQAGGFAWLKVSAVDLDANETYIATQQFGDAALAAGRHTITWDMEAEGLTFKSTNVVFKVAGEVKPATYCVVDLSGGSSASSYPITLLTEPPSGGFNVDAYKTTKLVLRRIEAGSYKMGGSYDVTLTKAFFCGIFEVTQKQYTQVMGSNPSSNKGDKRPVEMVSYDMIRGSTNGAKWPASSAVDSSSFMGKLRAKTGMDFDLPTAAQWEYACRASTTTSYNNGGNTENDLKKLGRYSGNVSDGKGGYSSGHTVVGSYTANSWALYDMHGNAWEWCLDWSGTNEHGVDPKGPTSGSRRISYGGSWVSDSSACTSSSTVADTPTTVHAKHGFRIVRTLQY